MVLTEREYVGQLKTYSGKVLEDAWAEQFNTVVGADTILQDPVGPQDAPQREEQTAAAANNKVNDLVAHPKPKCINKGDCERHGAEVIKFGLILQTYCCRHLRDRHRVIPFGARRPADVTASMAQATSKSEGADMLAVFEIRIDDGGRAGCVTRFVSAHACYSPFRLVSWNTAPLVSARGPERERLLFTQDGVPEFQFFFAFLAALSVNWGSIASCCICVREFRCTRWDEYDVGDVIESWNGMQLSSLAGARLSSDLQDEVEMFDAQNVS
jgi:hypothetical protein